jgi:isoleucyl-tRNA synthetase
VLVERVGLEGWAVAADDGLTVALDTALDDDLRLEADLYDLIRAVQVLRKDTGLQVTDRIRLWIPDERLLAFADRIAAETLAVSVEADSELRLERAAT